MTEIIKVRFGREELAAEAKKIIDGWDDYSIRVYPNKADGKPAGFRPTRAVELHDIAGRLAAKHFERLGMRIVSRISLAVEARQDTIMHVDVEFEVRRCEGGAA